MEVESNSLEDVRPVWIVQSLTISTPPAINVHLCAVRVRNV